MKMLRLWLRLQMLLLVGERDDTMRALNIGVLWA
jgi:hypothetical protein